MRLAGMISSIFKLVTFTIIHHGLMSGAVALSVIRIRSKSLLSLTGPSAGATGCLQLPPICAQATVEANARHRQHNDLRHRPLHTRAMQLTNKSFWRRQSSDSIGWVLTAAAAKVWSWRCGTLRHPSNAVEAAWDRGARLMSRAPSLGVGWWSTGCSRWPGCNWRHRLDQRCNNCPCYSTSVWIIQPPTHLTTSFTSQRIEETLTIPCMRFRPSIQVEV